MEIKFDTPRAATPEDFAHAGPGALQEAMGSTGPETPSPEGSIQAGLGHGNTEGFRSEAAMAKLTGKKLPAPESTGPSKEVANLQEQLDHWKGEAGRLGREIIGPLRKENEALSARLDELAAQVQQNSTRPAPETSTPPATTQDYAKALYGDEVDLTDPATVRDGRLAKALHEATRTEIDAKFGRLEQMLNGLAEQMSGNVAMQNSGITQAQLKEMAKTYPELQKLAPAEQASLARRLLENAKAAEPTPAPPTLPAGYRPELAVEASGSGFSTPVETQSAQEFREFQSLNGEQQQNALIQMLNGGR